MKRTLFLICSLLLLALGLQAQKLTVESMSVATNDISASTSRRMDLNGQPCGLVKVQMAIAGATFDGSIIDPVDYKMGEYWVYMTEGSYMLQIKHPNFLPLNLNFRDYGIKKVETLTTYQLVVLIPVSSLTPLDEGMRYLALNVSPTNSIVSIDGNVQSLDADGNAIILLPQGTHSYVVSAPGYAEERGEIRIGQERVTKRIVLQSAMSQVNISCPTPGAQIYVNDQLKGKSPWSGRLSAGNYLFEARLDGHRTAFRTETIAGHDTCQIDIPALMPITGNLDVNYKPLDAEVWLDGKKIGVSPDIFRNIPIGDHEVEVRANGYQSKKHPVTITENQTTPLTGSLDRDKKTVVKPETKPAVKPETKPAVKPVKTSTVKPKTNSSSVPSRCGYAQGVFQAGSLMAVGASVGGYVGGFNMEASYLLGLSKSEDIYWNSTSDADADYVLCSYKPTVMGLKLGYGIPVGESMRLTLQAGFNAINISGNGSKGYATAATVGLRAEYIPTSHLMLFAAPELGLNVGKSDVYKQLADVSDKIKSWAGGFNVRLGLSVSF